MGPMGNGSYRDRGRREPRGVRADLAASESSIAPQVIDRFLNGGRWLEAEVIEYPSKLERAIFSSGVAERGLAAEERGGLRRRAA